MPLTVRVRVPATSANLGPGFDTLGLALNIYNFVTIQEAPDGRDAIEVTGEGEDTLTSDDTNIALIAACHLLRAVEAPPIALHLHLHNAIPLARGLGSSAAARVGALCAANEWAARNGWGSVSPSELLFLATELEGHPDNAAAALLGGLVVSTLAEESEVGAPGLPAVPGLRQSRAFAVRVPVEKFPALVAFVPEGELATKTARAVLPDAVFRADANFNVARTGLLVAALATGQWDALGEALRDKLHQDHRAGLMPGFNAMLRAAREAGAFGATLSGAGPTVLAWLPPDDAALSLKVQRAMQDAAAEHEVFGEVMEVGVDSVGCVVEDES